MPEEEGPYAQEDLSNAPDNIPSSHPSTSSSSSFQIQPSNEHSHDVQAHYESTLSSMTLGNPVSASQAPTIEDQDHEMPDVDVTGAPEHAVETNILIHLGSEIAGHALNPHVLDPISTNGNVTSDANLGEDLNGSNGPADGGNEVAPNDNGEDEGSVSVTDHNIAHSVLDFLDGESKDAYIARIRALYLNLEADFRVQDRRIHKLRTQIHTAKNSHERAQQRLRTELRRRRSEPRGSQAQERKTVKVGQVSVVPDRLLSLKTNLD